MKLINQKMFIKDNIAYLDKEHTIRIGYAPYSKDSKSIEITFDVGDIDSYPCCFCGTTITEMNSGSVKLFGIDKLDRRKMEKVNEFDQKITNICSKCVLSIYRMIFGEFKVSKLPEKRNNEAARKIWKS